MPTIEDILKLPPNVMARAAKKDPILVEEIMARAPWAQDVSEALICIRSNISSRQRLSWS